jgi:superfamily I DNA/RNA helicase
MKANSIDELLERLIVWRDREVSRAAKDNNEAGIERIHDQYDCLRFFVDNLPEDRRSVDALLTRITKLFTDDEDKGVVTLSTVHKAKGLEWDRVFLLDKPKYMPSKFAKLPWQIVQENNLIYVAITRAKSELYYINSGTWDEGEEEEPFITEDTVI